MKKVLLLLGLVATGCATSKNKVCDSIFFVPVNCVDPANPLGLPPLEKKPVVVASAAPALVATPDPAPEPTAPPPPEPPPPPPEIPSNNAVYFGVGDDAITPGSGLTLGAIAKYLTAVKNETITLAAYTDPVGSPVKNREVAARRAKAVMDRLVLLGVPADRITIAPYQLKKKTELPKDEFWRLRKVALIYGPETLARLQAIEDEDDRRAESDIPTERHPVTKPKEASKPKDPKAATASKDPAKPEKPEEDGKKLETVDIIYWKNVNHALFILAKRFGFFEQEGFNVRLHESKMEANEVSIKLADEVGAIKTIAPRTAGDMKSRRYFLGAVCPYGVHEALSKKMPFVSIGSMLTIPNTVIMKKSLVDQMRKDLSSFRGTIGRVRQNISEIEYVHLFTDRLRQLGLKEGKEFKYVFFDSYSAMYDALIKGEVTAINSAPPVDQEIVDKHPELGLLPMAALNLNLPCCRQLVTRENLQKNREKYVRFERAVIRAQRFLVEHPNESVEALSKFLSLPQGTVRGFISRPGFSFSANPNVKGQVAFADVMKARLGAAKVGDIREAIDTSVYEEALATLLKEEPSNSIYGSMLNTYKRTR